MMAMTRRSRILLGISALTAAVAVAAGLFVTWQYRKATLDEAFTRLALFHGLRKATLEDYMRSKASDVRAMSRNHRVMTSFVQLRDAWGEAGGDPAGTLRRLYVDDNPFDPGNKDLMRSAGDDSRYTQAHAEFHDWARRFLEHFGYTDLYLIGAGGNILYSVEKSDDFATNLDDGPYAAGALGYVYHQAARQGENRVTLSDFEHYEPGGGPPSAFAGSAITGKDGTLLGVLAVRFTGGPIDDILRYVPGMGETGQTYIVGNDFLMRSQSRFERQPTVLAREVDTAPARAALNGFSGSQIGLDYRGEEVLSVYSALDFGGAPWVLLAEIEKAEALKRAPLWPGLLAALIAGVLTAIAANIATRLYFGR